LSRFVPVWSSFDLGTRHRGQGQRPLFRMVASKTLSKELDQEFMKTAQNLAYFSG